MTRSIVESQGRLHAPSRRFKVHTRMYTHTHTHTHTYIPTCTQTQTLSWWLHLTMCAHALYMSVGVCLSVCLSVCISLYRMVTVTMTWTKHGLLWAVPCTVPCSTYSPSVAVCYTQKELKEEITHVLTADTPMHQTTSSALTSRRIPSNMCRISTTLQCTSHSTGE